MAVWDDREYGPQVVRSLHSTRREFRRVWPWLQAAADRYGRTNTMDGVWARIADGECQLWVEPEAAVLTVIDVYRDTGLRDVRCWLAGGRIDDALKIEDRITVWAKTIGAERILITGRRGWLRALDGYEETMTTMVKDLHHG